MTTTQHAFQTEVQQLLHLVIHSLYSEREIFLRELISNASDACDKLRFLALTEPELLRGDEGLRVRVRFDQEAKTITIEDNGIGLTEEEAVRHLGTIAQSGTREFVSAAESGKADLAGLIGQFGVGFYSAFMVANQVVVESRSARVSSDAGLRWESDGSGGFATETISRPQRGTSVTLHLKDDAVEFAARWRLESLIKKYSDFVVYPVELPKAGENADANDFEQVNSGKPLWSRPRAELSDEDYTTFYRTGLKQFDEPATWLHAQVEGQLAWTCLLYIPGSKPFDLFDRDRKGLSLYVRRVFIMDDCTELLPEWLRFVRGVVDSDDLPLNVSREMIQDHAILPKLRKQLTKRVLDHLDKLAGAEDEASQKAWRTICEQFGAVLREGLVTDFEQRERVAKLARWPSSWTEAQEGEDKPLTSLTDYLARKQEGQEAIWYVTAANLEAARCAPQAEALRAKGVEVLYWTDPVDEWVSQHLTEFEKIPLRHVARSDADAGEVAAELTERFAPLCSFAQERVTGLKEVRLSARLTDSPCCLVANAQDVSPQFEEILRRAGQQVPAQQRVLELNPSHPLVEGLLGLHADEGRRDELATHLQTLHDQALLAEGGRLSDPGAFARRVQALLAGTLGQ